MRNDPMISSDDLQQDYAITRHTRGEFVAMSTYIRRRQIDAARQYTRRGITAQRLPRRTEADPVQALISKERSRIVLEALRQATPSQQKFARLLMMGYRQCDIAKRLGVSRSAVTHILQRLRPLLLNAR